MGQCGPKVFLGDGGGFEANIGRAAVRFIQPAPKESCLTAHTSHAFLHSSLIHQHLLFLHLCHNEISCLVMVEESDTGGGNHVSK